MALADRVPQALDQRQRQKFVQVEQPGAQAIVDVVIVVRNIVRDGGDLRLETGPAAELEIQRRIGFLHRPCRRSDRPVVLGQPLECFPAEIESVEIRVGGFEPGDDADRMGIVVEAAGRAQRRAQRILSGMAEGRMAKVVREAQSFGQILVEAERARHRAADLRHLEAVGQANPEMIAVRGNEHLGLVAQATKSNRVDQAVAIPLENVARAARAGVAFRMKAAARSRGMCGERRRKAHSTGSGAILSAGELVNLKASTPRVSRSWAKIAASEAPRNGPTSSRARSALRAT